MTITQTIEVPADHKVFFEFLAPQEIPAGKTTVEMTLTPVKDSDTVLSDKERMAAFQRLDGCLKGCDLSIDEARAERIVFYI